MQQKEEKKYISELDRFFAKTQEIVCILSASKAGLDYSENKKRTIELCKYLKNGDQFCFYLDAYYSNKDNGSVTESIIFVKNVHSRAKISFIENLYASCLYKYDQHWGLIRLPTREFQYFTYSYRHNQPEFPNLLNKKIESLADLAELFKSIKGDDYKFYPLINENFRADYSSRMASMKSCFAYVSIKSEISSNGISIAYGNR